MDFRRVVFIVSTLILLLTPLHIAAQTQVQQLFNKALYFDNSGLVGQSDVQLLDDGPASTRGGFAQKNLFFHGEKFYLSHQWNQNAVDNNDVYLRTSSDGITWSSRSIVNDDPGGTQQRKSIMAIGGDPQQPKICIVWQDQRNPAYQLRGAVSTDGGQTFTPSIQISNHASSDNIIADVAVDANGDFYVVWNRSSSGNYYQTWFSRTTDNGQTWLPQKQVHFGRVFSFPSQIVARGNGELLIGICDDQNSRSNLVVYSSMDSGDNWQQETQATNYGFQNGFRYFSLLKDEADTVHFLYEYISSGQIHSYRHMTTSDWGGSWSNDRAASDTTQGILQVGHSVWNAPGITVSPSGAIYASWADTRIDPSGPEYTVFLSRSTDGGQTWLPDIQLNEMLPVDTKGFVSVAVKSDGINDTLAAVWTETRTFAGANPPNPFSLLIPNNNALFTFSNPIPFGWQQSIDPDGDPVTYDLKIWDNDMQHADTVVAGLSTINRSFNAPGYLKFGGQYRWTVSATDGANTTASIDTFSFGIVDPEFPTALQQPTNNTQISDIQSDIQFTWFTDSIRANSSFEYEFRLFNAISDTSIANITEEQFTFNGGGFFNGNATYQWCVLANDGFVTVSSDTFMLRTPDGILAGEYTIGNGGSFPDLSSAASVLNSFGIAGPTTFKVLPGIYQEKFRLEDIAGQGDDNPIVFESQSGNASDVLIEYQQTSGDTSMVVVENVENITFRGLSFKAIDNPYDKIQILSVLYGQKILIEDCRFEGPLDKRTTRASLFTYAGGDITIRDNSFLGNGYGVLTRGVGSLTLAQGVRVEGNIFTNCNQMAIYMLFLDAPICHKNQIEHKAIFPALMLNRCVNDFEVTANSIRFAPKHTQATQYHAAVRMVYCDGSSTRAQVTNNMVGVTAPDTTELAIGLELLGGQNISVLHNSIYISGSSLHEARYALSTWGNTSGIILRNNIFSAGRGGLAYSLSGDVDADYNLLHGIGPYVANVAGTSYNTVTDLQRLSGMEQNSPSAPMSFLADLHSAGAGADGRAIPLPEVTFDIDGEPRDPSTPDIGADEYSPQISGLNGNYVIGEGKDFNDLQSAAEALHLLGIQGPVTFEVQPGTYGGLYLSEFEGASAASLVTFRSQTGRSEDVLLEYTSNIIIRHLINLNGSNHLRFDRLTLKGVLNQYWYGMMHLEGDVDNLSITNCHFEASPEGGVGVLLRTSADSSMAADELLLKGNRFTRGPVILNGHATTPMRNTRVNNNRFVADSLVYYQLNLGDQESPIVQFNNLVGTGNTTWYIGLHVVGSESIQIANNRIRAVGVENSQGIRVAPMIGANATASLFNNFVVADADSNQAGITLYNLAAADLFYNSILVDGGQSQQINSFSGAIFANTTDLSMLNTIAVNKAGGGTLYLESFTNINVSDYNNHFVTGSELFRVGDSTYTDLASVRAASGLELNSLSVDPFFLSDTDLHLSRRSTLDNKGTPIAGISRDIDGQNRSVTTPDIGADEFSGRRVVIRRKGGLDLVLPPNPPRRDKIIVNGLSNLLQNGYVLADLHVQLDTLLHPNVSDLDIFLSHNGIRDTLVYALPAVGSNFINTIFDDSSAQSIEQGGAPYTGRYRPSGLLGSFIGTDPEGEWEIEIVNNGSDSSGVLQAWGLELEFEFLTALDDPAISSIPAEFILQQNYPNPFNPETTIGFALPESSRPKISIYNSLGQLVKRITSSSELPAGWHQVRWDATDAVGNAVSSGIYFYRLEANSQVMDTKKMLLIR